MDLAIGIDVGGTSIKSGAFSTAGELLAEKTVRMKGLDNDAAYATIVDALREIVADAAGDDGKVLAIGLDIPGPVDEDGKVGFMPNATMDLEGFKAALLTAFPDAKLAVVNDANAAAMGELWQGSAAGERSFVMVTLGTGVGGGVVADGNLVAGKHGAGGEIGHITVNLDEERKCGCGRKGCLEQYASATGIVRMYREECERQGVEPVELEHDTDTFTLFRHLEQGNEQAKVAISKMCDYLGLGLSQISCVTNPGVFVIGGGVSAGIDLFRDELQECYRKYALPLCADTPFVSATLANRAGIYGSAYEALRVAGLAE